MKKKKWVDLGVRRRCHGKTQKLVKVEKIQGRGQYTHDERTNQYTFHLKDVNKRANIVVTFICPEDGLTTQMNVR